MVERLSLIAYPPKDLYRYLHKRLINTGIITCQNENIFNGFDPHITFAYWPSKIATIEKLYFEIQKICKKHLPLKIQYNGLYISEYNTVNIYIEPKAKCKYLHQELLKAILPYLKNSRIYSEEQLFEIFNTCNVFHSFNPHLTIIKASDQKEANMIMNSMSDFVRVNQVIDNLTIANATSPPLYPMYNVISE